VAGAHERHTRSSPPSLLASYTLTYLRTYLLAYLLTYILTYLLTCSLTYLAATTYTIVTTLASYTLEGPFATLHKAIARSSKVEAEVRKFFPRAVFAQLEGGHGREAHDDVALVVNPLLNAVVALLRCEGGADDTGAAALSHALLIAALGEDYLAHLVPPPPAPPEVPLAPPPEPSLLAVHTPLPATRPDLTSSSVLPLSSTLCRSTGSHGSMDSQSVADSQLTSDGENDYLSAVSVQSTITNAEGP